MINQVAVNMHGRQSIGNRNSLPSSGASAIEDILWAVGIWSVILCLSPVIVFYMLMVA